ncbi:MAG: oligosaccharide flippase family protein [Sedimentisphaerales bacterium]|nr:oligosaccharide flippase family protein [Sedimentisphaerales bacterium]
MATGKTGKQVAGLSTATLISVATGFGISVANTRLMNPAQFGAYKWLEFVYVFAATIVTFGFFASGARLLAKKENTDIRPNLNGTIVTLALIMSIIMTAALFVYSFFAPSKDGVELGNVIRGLSPIAFSFVMILCLPEILKGDNKIGRLSALRCLPQVLYLAVAAFLVWGDKLPYVAKIIPAISNVNLTAQTALLLRYGISAIILLLVAASIRPRLSKWRKNLAMIWQENRIFGWQVYLGTLAGTTTTQLGGVLIGITQGTTASGPFGLALNTTMPLIFMPGIVGTVLFKRFANSNSIPKQTIAVSLTASLAILAFYQLVIQWLFQLVFPDYMNAVILARILAIECTIRGLGDLAQHFLRAHGIGKAIRNTFIIMGIANIAGYAILLPIYGAMGVVITRTIMSSTYLLLMWYHCSKVQKNRP